MLFLVNSNNSTNTLSIGQIMPDKMMACQDHFVRLLKEPRACIAQASSPFYNKNKRPVVSSFVSSSFVSSSLARAVSSARGPGASPGMDEVAAIIENFGVRPSAGDPALFTRANLLLVARTQTGRIYTWDELEHVAAGLPLHRLPDKRGRMQILAYDARAAVRLVVQLDPDVAFDIANEAGDLPMNKEAEAVLEMLGEELPFGEED